MEDKEKENKVDEVINTLAYSLRINKREQRVKTNIEKVENNRENRMKASLLNIYFLRMLKKIPNNILNNYDYIDFLLEINGEKEKGILSEYISFEMKTLNLPAKDFTLFLLESSVIDKIESSTNYLKIKENIKTTKQDVLNIFNKHKASESEKLISAIILIGGTVTNKSSRLHNERINNIVIDLKLTMKKYNTFYFIKYGVIDNIGK